MENVNLNVVFHGLFAFVEGSNGMDVLIPDMGAEHVYRAGEWLGETTIQPSEQPYILSGVSRDGTASFDEKMNLIIKGVQPTCSRDGVYARLQLPRPNRIVSLRQTTLGPEDLWEAVEGTVSSRTISAVQALTYRVDGDPSQVRLGNHTMTRSAQQAGDEFYMNLHIIAGPDQPEQWPHILNGFERTIALAPELAGKLVLKNSAKFPPLTDASLVPPGCILDEFLDPSQRVERLAFYGRQVREALVTDPEAAVPGWSDMLVGAADEIHSCALIIFVLPWLSWLPW